MNQHKPLRFGRHLATDHWSARRAFPPHVLKRIESAITLGEQTHSGQIRFVVEAALPLTQVLRSETPRDRALEVFGRLRIWDTEENCGVLVYVLLADKAVEIVADRGIHRKVGDATWQAICRAMEGAFRERHFEEGAVEGIEAISGLLSQSFPRIGGGENELPDQAVIL